MTSENTMVFAEFLLFLHDLVIDKTPDFAYNEEKESK